MTQQLAGKRVAFLFAHGVEQVELTEPLEAIRAAGASVTLVSLRDGRVQMYHQLEAGGEISVDVAVADTHANCFDALVLPGGVANPDALRTDADAVGFVRGFFAEDKPVAVICHAPWTLIEADVVAGRTLTSWPSLATDLRNAGANWVDAEVHVDGALVSSRRPDDLSAFITAAIEVFADVPTRS